MKEELLIQGMDSECAFVDAARMVLEHRVTNMLLHEPGVREGEDIEALHDMRVYSRRLREALRIFESCCDRKHFKSVYKRVRNITVGLGEVRNLDVFIAFFARYGQEDGAPDSLVEASDKLIEWAKKKRDKLRHGMLKQLDDLRPDELKDDVMGLIPAPPPEQAAPEASAAREREEKTARMLKARYSIAFRARRLVHEREDVVEEAWAAAEAASGSRSVEFHELRISFKKIRYALETLYPAFTMEDLDRIYANVKEYQDILGDIHDNDVFHAVVQKKRRKAEAKGDNLLAAGYFTVSARLVTRRHELETQLKELQEKYPLDLMLKEIDGAFVPVKRPRKRKKKK